MFNLSGLLLRFMCEIIGTFIFIFLIFTTTSKLSGSVNVALPIGLALALSIYVFGDITGGHFNPAVSFAIYVQNPKIFTGIMLLIYCSAQAIGGILAYKVHSLLQNIL
jgi:glycerol uptake facilitator-like aquaporin